MTAAGPTTPNVASDRRRVLLPLFVAVDVVIADQLTKWWAIEALTDPPRDIDIVGSLRFNLVYNTGMAFSRGEGMGGWIGIVAVVLVVGLAVAIRRLPDLRTAIPMALIAGGAVGNLIDRFFRGDGFLDGAVIDFIDLQWWPVFNIADAAVVIGGVALLVFGRHPTAA